MPISPYTDFHAAEVNYPLPSSAGHSWQSNRTAIQNEVSNLGAAPMMGATNLSAGLDLAVSVLTTGPNSKAFANKVIILLTDGQWNDGRDPVAAAIDARNAGVTVHCVLMLTADQPDIQQVATITGGRYYLTQNEAELRAAFQELARSLPVVLTQ
jgi:Mg-chelatase subunit ChlD